MRSVLLIPLTATLICAGGHGATSALGRLTGRVEAMDPAAWKAWWKKDGRRQNAKDAKNTKDTKPNTPP